MKIEFDPNKSERNEQLRKLPFEKAAELDWDTAVVFEDTRQNYFERRFSAYIYLGTRLHALCFKKIKDGIRVISFRKANLREVRKYEKTATTITNNQVR